MRSAEKLLKYSLTTVSSVMVWYGVHLRLIPQEKHDLHNQTEDTLTLFRIIRPIKRGTGKITAIYYIFDLICDFNLWCIKGVLTIPRIEAVSLFPTVAILWVLLLCVYSV